MTGKAARFVVVLAAFALLTEPAFAHHLMGGHMPATFMQGILSGLGHPVIGIDHFAAVVAIGCLAAAHRAGAALAVSFVAAMMAGVAVHLHGTTVPAAELLVALSVLILGLILLRAPELPVSAALGLFVLIGLTHGYALGESIYGAERTPLVAYLIGLAAIQSAVALGAIAIARGVMREGARPLALRFIGAGIAGVGIAVLMQQIIPAPPA